MEYYIKKENVIQGPFTDQQIHSAMKSGQLKRDSLVSNSKSGPWKTIAQVSKPATDSKVSNQAYPVVEAVTDQDVNLGSHSAPSPPPIQPKAQPVGGPNNNYWNRLNSPGQAGSSPAGKSASRSGKSDKYDLNRMKKAGAERDTTADETKKGLIIAGSAISALVLFVMALVFVIFILPMFAHQSEFRQAKDTFKEAVRTVGYAQRELARDEPNVPLLRRYEERLLDLGADMDKIMDNWSESEQNRFKAWCESEGMNYADRRGVW